MKIFVSIASYRDPLLLYTVTEAYNNARYKENLVFGIVDQSYPQEALRVGTLPFRNQIRYINVAPEQSRGCCWARNVAQSLWAGEEYFFQIDSHIGFDPDWDVYFLDHMESLLKWHNKPVISSYPDAMEAENHDINTPIIKSPHRGHDTITSLVVAADGKFGGDTGHFLGINAINYSTKDNVVHGYLIAAGATFTIGSVCTDVPYDPQIFFAGEEQLYALRMWTHGYSIFHTKEMPLYHYYGNEYRTTFWDKKSDKLRGVPTQWFEDRSKKRMNAVFSGHDYGPYGLGTERTIYDYSVWTGIDYRGVRCEPHAYTGLPVFSMRVDEQPPTSGAKAVVNKQADRGSTLSGSTQGLVLSGGMQ